MKPTVKQTATWLKTEDEVYINTMDVHGVGGYYDYTSPEREMGYVLIYMTKKLTIDDSYVLYTGTPEECEKYLEELFDEPLTFYGKVKMQ